MRNSHFVAAKRSQSILPLFMQPLSIWRFLRDPKAGWGAKAALLFAAAYAVWPLDLIPDLVPLISWLDDAGVASAAIAWAAASVQRHARERKTAEIPATTEVGSGQSQ